MKYLCLKNILDFLTILGHRMKIQVKFVEILIIYFLELYIVIIYS